MRHPFDGLNQPALAAGQPEAKAEGLSRRSALGKMVFAAAGFVALPALVRGQIAVTNAINEAGGPVATTLALGEEGAVTTAVGEAGAAPAGVTTEPFGEEAGRVTSRAVPGLEDGTAAPVTQAVREAGGPLTRAANEDGRVTTQAVGEEGAATGALNENGGATTKAVGEEGGAPVTEAKGEAGAGVGGQIVIVKPLALELKDKQLETTYADLGSKEQPKAVQACAVIYGSKQAITFLKGNIKVNFAQADDQKIAQMINDLDADAFAAREKAEKDLANLGPAAVPALQAALQNAKSAEMRMRLQRLIDNSKELPVMVQATRALEVLIALKTPEAKAVIEELAKGNEKEWLTQEAKKALVRAGK